MEFQHSDQRYEEALGWLFSRLPMFSRVGGAAYKPGLDNTLRLDRLFGSPHRRFNSIHVAGTNGKGSTSHMIAAVLQSAGYKTALYTSPHLTDFRERMRVNGKMIPQGQVVEFIDRWQQLEKEKKQETEGLKPSFFELTMMMAFDWFAREEVDYAVIEVGMGGRLDSTNVITPLLSVITNISLDHTQFLGSDLEAIAGEKAGIIKPGIPVVVGEAEGPVRDVFVQKAAIEKSPIFFAEEEGDNVGFGHTPDGWDVCLPDGTEFTVPLPGLYQKKNIRTVIAALEILRKIGVGITEEALCAGLSHVDILTGLRGRWQKVGTAPDIICDTGHNTAGICETMEGLRRLYPGNRIRFVIGFVNDKDVAHIVQLFPKEGFYYFTQAQIPRAMKAIDVAYRFSEAGISGRIFPTVPEALAAALSDALPSDVVYVGGSTFIVADFLASIPGTII